MANLVGLVRRHAEEDGRGTRTVGKKNETVGGRPRTATSERFSIFHYTNPDDN
jgi:hypothetical protein